MTDFIQGYIAGIFTGAFLMYVNLTLYYAHKAIDKGDGDNEEDTK